MRTAVMAIVLSASATLAATTDARAEPIVWHAPAGCPSLESVRAKVEQRLGGPLAVGGEIPVDIRFERPEFQADVDFRAITVKNDVRHLHAPRCDDLADAVALLIARVASEHVGDLERPEDREVAPPPPNAPVPSVAIAAPAEDTGPREWGYGLRFLGLSGVGGVPEVGIGGEVAAHARRHDLFAEVAFAHWIPTRSHGVDVGLGVAELRAGWSPEALPIRGWATAEYGAMTAELDGMDASQRWVAFGAGFGVAWPMSPLLRVVGSVEFVVPVDRVNFVLSNGSSGYQAWPVTSRAAFGLEVGFP